jgi:hypothetical protein
MFTKPCLQTSSDLSDIKPALTARDAVDEMRRGARKMVLDMVLMI